MARLILRGIVATSAAFGIACLPAGLAHADEPIQQGWWTTANVGGPAPAKPPPDVPSDGLLVQGGLGGPSAFAAVVYEVNDGATVGPLTLTVAPQSATTPGAKLEACPLTSPSIQEDQGGPMSDAPKYSCAHNAPASPDGNTYKFTVSSLVSKGALAVAILPTRSSDRVVFSKPGASSLTVTASAPPSGQTDFSGAPPPSPATSPRPLTPSGGAALAAAPPVQPGPAAPVPAMTPPAPQVAPSPTPSATASQNAFAAAAAGPANGKPNSGALAAVLGAIAVAAAFWMYAGRDKASGIPDEA